MGAPYDPEAYWEDRGNNYTAEPGKQEKDLGMISKWLLDHGVKALLEVGPGWGRAYQYLRRRQAFERYAMVDFVDSMRDNCERVTGIRPDAWDGVTLPYEDKSFECVLACDVILHVPPAQVGHFFGELLRVSSRWVYLTTFGIIGQRELAPHCFWHDHVQLASDTLAIPAVTFLRNGTRAHWTFERRR